MGAKDILSYHVLKMQLLTSVLCGAVAGLHSQPKYLRQEGYDVPHPHQV